MENYILILYYSRYGAVKKLAEAIADGVERVSGISAKLRTVPSVSPSSEQTTESIPADGDLYVTADDLRHCVGLALGSPTRFGNMAAPLKYFLDTTADIWLSGELINKPACVFSSSSSLHGGQESTLLTMMLPLIHHGMVIAGIPYSEAELHSTQSGGTPYGVTHVAYNNNDADLTAEEQRLAIAQGQRLAELALKLN